MVKAYTAYKAYFHLHADDTVIYCSASTLAEAIDHMQCAFNVVQKLNTLHPLTATFYRMWNEMKWNESQRSDVFECL